MNRQIGWSTESNLLWQIGNQIDRMTSVIGSSLSTFVPQSRTLTINGVTYDLSADRSWTVSGGISGTGAAGQVAYWTGVSSQAGSNNLFWNNTNQTLGIGTTGPVVVSAGYSYLALNNSVTGGVIEFQSNGTRIATINNNASQFDIETKISAPITFGTNGSEHMRLAAAGNLLVGTTSDNGSKFQVSGDVSISGVFRETITTNSQIASYSLALPDNGKLVLMNVATANNLTIPLNSSVNFPVGTKIDVQQTGAGQTTVVATSGVTINSAGGALKLRVQYSGATLVQTATNVWSLFGDITT